MGAHKFVSIEELIMVNDIADLLNHADIGGRHTVFPGEAGIEIDEIKHKDSDFHWGYIFCP